MILGYLNRSYYTTIKDEEKPEKIVTNPYSQYIWTAWLQGEQEAPEVIQLTLKSIRRNSNGHNVVVITEENVDNYIKIPPTIKKKHADGIIGYAHYADIIRMLILAEYGGIWLDATIFLHNQIDVSAFSYPFWSIGFESNKKARYVSDNRWIVRVMGGCDKSKYLFQISKMLNNFWIEHDISIDYFVFDYLIAVLYNNDLSFRQVVDRLKKQNGYTNRLRLVIKDPYNEKVLNELFSDNRIYTLTYKYHYPKQTVDGQITNYGYLYNQYFNTLPINTKETNIEHAKSE